MQSFVILQDELPTKKGEINNPAPSILQDGWNFNSYLADYQKPSGATPEKWPDPLKPYLNEDCNDNFAKNLHVIKGSPKVCHC